MTAAVLETDGLDVARGRRVLCAGLDLRVAPGQWWGVLGLNGSGKTTLLHVVAGLLPALSGRVLLSGEDIGRLGRRAVARRVGLLPQDSVDPFPSTVLETALIGRHPHLGPWRSEGPDDLLLAREALEKVDLSALAGRQVDTLSGGERRRLAMATLLVQDPSLFLLDEPANHLDLRRQVEVLDRVRERVDAGRAALMSVHDPTLAARYCDHVLLMFADGSWEAGEREAMLTGERLSRLYDHPIKVSDTGHGRAFLPA